MQTSNGTVIPSSFFMDTDAMRLSLKQTLCGTIPQNISLRPTCSATGVSKAVPVHRFDVKCTLPLQLGPFMGERGDEGFFFYCWVKINLYIISQHVQLIMYAACLEYVARLVAYLLLHQSNHYHCVLTGPQYKKLHRKYRHAIMIYCKARSSFVNASAEI